MSSRDSSKPRRFPVPCLDCGTLTRNAAYCIAHERPKLYDQTYSKTAKIIRDTATICHICGRGPDQADPWTADHVIAGDRASELKAAHRSCNSRKGAT